MNTWTDIKAAFDDVTGDSSRIFFPAAAVVRWANLALDDLCDAARYVDTAVTADTSTSGITSLSGGGYAIWRVEYDDEVLWPITRDKLRTADRDWNYRTGTPRFYYLDQTGSVPDYLQFGIWEKTATNEVGALRVWVHSYPTDVSDSSPSSEIDVPDWAVSAVLFYMLVKAYESDTKLQNFDTAAVYRMMYEDIKERLVVRSKGRQPKSWIMGYEGRPTISVINRLPDRVPEP